MKRKPLLVLAGLLLGVLLPLAMHAGGGPVGYGLTAGRVISILTGLVGIAGLVNGVRSVQQTGANHTRLQRARIAIVSGLLCVTLSIIHLETAKGGFGTGSGRAGAIVGLVAGLAAVVTGSLGRKLVKEGGQ